ncbi:unnamed protein product [Lactuca virosa]|uniref:FBD domain-containing protein n=1 Tax=Lactuca virosa TaxID=75947 RepID=A0AAU9NTQ0_9ASTR|nr:unnamed protein product [Lactuca virosa]
MMLLSRNGVRELILTDSNQRYELPSYVFSCLELTKLKLRNCFFKPPLKVEGFLNLNDLELWNIDFRANLCGTQINLPQLKKLSMSWCTNVYNFNINATKLQALIVIRCPDAMLLRLLQSPYLTLICVSFQKPIEDNVQVEKTTLPIMLSNLRKIVVLYLDGFFFKALIAEKIPKWLPHPVNSLKRLFFVDVKLDDLDQLHGALCLLRNSPKLESLSVMSFNMNPQAIYYDVEPASNHLESPNCLDCRLHRLQTVKIECLEGSKPELLFIKLLLAHSPSLQKFTITTSRALNAKKIIDICKDVMRFPRASRKAEVIYSS